MKEKKASMPHRAVGNLDVFEPVTALRRETGNHFRLLRALTVGLLIPVLLVFIALAIQNAASNLENRRLITAFGAPNMTPSSLTQTLTNNPRIERVNVLQATPDMPAVLEIKPVESVTSAQIASLAETLESMREFSFVSFNQSLLERNTDAFRTAERLALILFLLAMVITALICTVIVRRELFRANSSSIKLQCQLGATLTAITRPYIYRAAITTLLAVFAATGLATVINKTVNHFVDISSYNALLVDFLPVGHLILLVAISVAAACFAAATALQSIFIYINQILKSFYSHTALPRTGNIA